jgi:drug/metabolite transporter (DMT)-like permease
MIITKKFGPYLALCSGILALSLSSLFIRWANAPGTVTSFYRMMIAGLVITPFFFRHINSGTNFSKKLIVLPLLGGLFTALDHSIWSTAIGMTKVANATLLNNIAPLWVALFAVLILRERLGRRFWVGLVFTLVGAGVVLGNDLIMNPHLSTGDILALTSSLFYAGYFLVTQRARQKLDTLTYIYLVIVTCSAILLGINLVLGKPLTGYPPQTYLAFLGAALISQIIGYFSVTYALGHLPAAVVSPTMIAQPVLTALLAIPLIGEPLLTSQWLGGLTVLAGIYLVNRSQPG